MPGLKVFILFALLLVHALVEAVPTAQLTNIAARQDSTSKACVRCCRLQRNFDRAQLGFTAAEGRLADANEAFDTAQAEVAAARNSKTEKDDQVRSLQALSERHRELMTKIQEDIETKKSPEGIEFLRTILQALRRDVREIRRDIGSIRRARGETVVAIEDALEVARNSRVKIADAERGLRRATRRKQTAQAALLRCLRQTTGTSETTVVMPTAMPEETSSEMPPVTEPEMLAVPELEMPETSPEVSPEM